MLNKKTEIARIQERQQEYLKNESAHMGGYVTWYKDLALVRKYIQESYIKYSTPWKTHRFVYSKLDSGDMVDHHIISYLSPLKFTRIGWSGRKLTQGEQIAKLRDFFEKRGVRFISENPSYSHSLLRPKVYNA